MVTRVTRRRYLFTIRKIILSTIKSNRNKFRNNIIVKLNYYLIIHKNNTYQLNSNFIVTYMFNYQHNMEKPIA